MMLHATVDRMGKSHKTAIPSVAKNPQTRHLSQRVRAFVGFLIKRFEGLPYWDECLEKRFAKTPDQQN